MNYIFNLTILFSFCSIFSPAKIQATDLACNAFVNVSLDENCSAEVTADMMLEGTYPDIDSYIVSFTESGQSPVILDGSMIGMTISITVTDPSDGNSCWGEILVEDKLAPQPICADVTVACFESTDVGVLPYPIVNDNCDSFIDTAYIDNEVDLSCGDPDFIKIIYRTWIFTDDGGNEGVCVQQINVLRGDLSTVNFPLNYDDIDQPTLSCDGSGWDANGNLYPDVDETGAPGGNSCSNIITNYEDTSVPICESSYKIIREWTIQDWCTSQIITHFQIIKIVGDGPTITAGPNVTISANHTVCSAEYNIPVPTISYPCTSGGPVPSYIVESDYGTLTQIGSNWIISELPTGAFEITVSVTDGCGDSDSDSFIITVIDNVPPVAICDEHTIVSLTTTTSNDGIAKVPAHTFDDGSFDNCGDVFFKVRRMNTGECNGVNGDDFPSVSGYQEAYDDYAAFCCEDETVMVVFRVYDVNPGVGPIADSRHEPNGDLFGHFNDCMIEVTVQDKIAPVILCPDDLTFDCTDDLSAELDDPYSSLLGVPAVVDNCTYDLTVNVEDNTVCGKSKVDPNNPGQYLYAYRRTFIASDGVGSSTCTQLIYVIDNNPFTGDDILWPSNIDVGCMESTDPDDTGEPVLDEAACGLLAVSYDDTFFQYVDGVCAKLLRTWTVLDWCQFDQNNPNQTDGIWTYTQVIKVVDDQAPILDCTDIVQTTCDTDPNDPCQFHVSFEQPMVIDNCAGYDTTIISETIVTIVFDTITQYFFDTIVDFEFDTMTTIVLDSTLVVNIDTVVEVEFECGMIDFELLPDGSTPFEGEMIGTQYLAGFGISFMLEDGTTPQIAETGGVVANAFGSAWGNDELMPGEPIGSFFLTDDGMLTGLTTPALVVMWDNPIDSVAFGLMDIDFDEFFVMEAKDIAGNTIVLDTIFSGDPMTGDGVFTDWAVQLPTNNVRSLRVEGNRMDAGAFGFGMDNLSFCSTDTLGTTIVNDTSFIVDVDTLINIAIDTIVTVEVDSSINITTDSLITVVNDTIITILGDFLFENEIDYFCDGVIDISGEGDVADTYHPIGEHKIIWTVTDPCGNESSCTVPFNVADCKQPTPVCINGLSTVIMPNAGEVTIWANDFNASSFDNCTPIDELLYSFSEDVTNTGMTFTCDNIGLNEVEIWVTDASGNSDYCTTYIFIGDNEEICDTIAPNPFMISTFTNYGDALPAVLVAADAVQLMTNVDGYAFHASDEDEIIFSPEKNTKPLNGVTTLDIVAIQKHLLGINNFDSPYKFIAADVNNSQSVSAIDMVELRKLILGIYQEFPENKSWRFVDEEFVFLNPDQPLPFAEEILINDQNMRMNIDFTAVKIGDVNGSATIAYSGALEDRNSETLLAFPNSKIAKDESAMIPVFTKEVQNILGLQFGLSAHNLQINRLVSGQLNLNASNYAIHNPSLISLSWNESSVKEIKSDEALFYLEVTALEDVNLNESLALNESITKSAWFSSEHAVEDINLVFSRASPEYTEAKNSLYQNYPNPFNGDTGFNFEIAEAAKVTIQIFDPIGNLVYEKAQYFEKGMQYVSLERSLFDVKGMYFYQISTDSFTAGKKMIHID